MIMYEINEVPWRVVDYYVERKPHSAIAQLLARSQTYTTQTKDTGELHPWSTWPTLHRGVYNDTHNIRFLNQELPEQHPPIWQLLNTAGVRTGVFLSLQSHPIPEGEWGLLHPGYFCTHSKYLAEKIRAVSALQPASNQTRRRRRTADFFGSRRPRRS